MKQQKLNLPFHSLKEILNLFHQEVNMLLKNFWKTLCLRKEVFILNNNKKAKMAFIPKIYLQSMGK